MSRKPRQGPGHNEQNRQTRESRSKSRMLHAGREGHFRYDVEEVLVKSGMEPEEWRPFLQTLWTQGSRQGIDEARDWVREQAAEGRIDHDVEKQVLDLVRQYSTTR